MIASISLRRCRLSQTDVLQLDLLERSLSEPQIFKWAFLILETFEVQLVLKSIVSCEKSLVLLNESVDFDLESGYLGLVFSHKQLVRLEVVAQRILDFVVQLLNRVGQQNMLIVSIAGLVLAAIIRPVMNISIHKSRNGCYSRHMLREDKVEILQLLQSIYSLIALN